MVRAIKSLQEMLVVMEAVTNAHGKQIDELKAAIAQEKEQTDAKRPYRRKHTGDDPAA
jgi:hypothetical protein